MRHLAVALTAALLVLAVPASAAEVSGVKLPDTMEVGGQTLQLNGAGLRKKFVVKVYAGALYLPEKSKDAGQVIAADVPKAVRMTFLRNLERGQVIGAFREGFEKNSRADLKEILPQLDQVAKVIPNEIREGQTMIVTYVPGKGSTVGMEGGESATIEGKTFADALFRNWIGDEPADEDLRKKMLGR